MSLNRAKTWLQHPAYTEAEWTARNPYLLDGEIAFVKVNGVVKKSKVGPGFFVDLSYIDDIYAYADAPTNPIGDASGSLQGQSVAEILFKMLNPYQTPVISSLVNNAGGTSGVDRVLEIGVAVNSPISLAYSLSNPANLLGATPINVNSGGVFDNDGNFANGPILLSRGTPLNPSLTNKVTIKVKATHQRGVTSEAITTISHHPKMIWGVSANPILAPGDWNTLTLRKTLISDSFEKDYIFGTAGYAHIAIPTMLGPGVLKFTEVTDPNSIWNYSVVDMGTQSINNGVTTYTYQWYRSEFYLNIPTIMRVRK